MVVFDMKKYLIVFILLLVMRNNAECFSIDNNTKIFSICAGAKYSDELYKKNDDKNIFFYSFEVNYKNFYLTDSEFGYKFDLYSNLFFTTYIDFLDGYSVYGNDMENGYKSIKKRKEQIATGGRFDYLFKNTKTSFFIQIGERGSSFGSSIVWAYPIFEKLSLLTELTCIFYSKKFTDYYFGIHTQDLGGELKKTYSPKNSFSYGPQLILDYQLTESFSIVALLNINRYSDEASSSPIVRNKTVSSGGLGLRCSL